MSLSLSERVVIQFPGSRPNAALIAAERAVRESARLFAYHKASELCDFSPEVPGSVARLRKLILSRRYNQHRGDKWAALADRLYILLEIRRLKRDRSKDALFSMRDMVVTSWGPGRVVGIVWQDRHCDTPHYRYSIEHADGSRDECAEAGLAPLIAQLAAE